MVSNSTSGEVTQAASPVAVAGYTAFGDSHSCGLNIESFSASDVGEWACVVNDEGGEDGVPFHRGTFQLMTDGFLGDIRLPRHLMPVVYDVELVPFILEDNFTTLGALEIHLDFNESVGDAAAHHNKVYMHVKEIAIDEDSVEITNILVRYDSL